MITDVNLLSLWVEDLDEAKDFYVSTLGFEVRDDITMGDYRWLTVGVPGQEDLEVTLAVPGPPIDDEDAAAVRRMLGKGSMNGGGLAVDDCRATCADLQAKGVEFVQGPTDRPYGVEAVLRDNSGNWWVLVERRPYAPADFGSA